MESNNTTTVLDNHSITIVQPVVRQHYLPIESVHPNWRVRAKKKKNNTGVYKFIMFTNIQTPV